MTGTAATGWQSPSTSAPDDRALSTFQCGAIGVMAFCVMAMNGFPVAWSSFPQVIAISGLLMLQRSPKAILAGAFSGPMRAFTLMFLALAAIALITAFASGDSESIGEALLRTVAPLLPFFALAGVSIRTRHVNWIIGGFVAGAAVLLLRATFALYAEWGVPDFNMVLWARFDVIRMRGYMDASLGNLSHLGLYVTLLAPFLIAVLAYFRVGRLMTYAIVLVLLLSLVNSVVSGSRTAIVLMLPMTALIFARRGPGALIVFFGIIAVLATIGIVYGLDPVSQTDLINRFIPSEGATGYDASAVERVDSIYLGWEVFKEHPLLGIGPGLSYKYISYTIPHESIVHMLLEMGVFGGILFLVISLATIAFAALAILAPDPDGRMHWRAAWLIGPAAYFFFGLTSGIAFTMSIAMVWIGAVYMMIPLAHARIVGDDAP